MSSIVLSSFTTVYEFILKLEALESLRLRGNRLTVVVPFDDPFEGCHLILKSPSKEKEVKMIFQTDQLGCLSTIEVLRDGCHVDEYQINFLSGRENITYINTLVLKQRDYLIE